MVGGIKMVEFLKYSYFVPGFLIGVLVGLLIWVITDSLSATQTEAPMYTDTEIDEMLKELDDIYKNVCKK